MIENSLWLIVGSLILILLIIIFPILNILEQQDEMIQLRLIDETDYFVRQIKNQGKLTQSMYENFNTKLLALGNCFEIKIERNKRSFVPVYQDPLLADSFSGQIETVYELETNREIIGSLYDVDNPSGVYHFNKGDFVVVKVVSKLKSKATQLRDKLWHVNTNTPTYYVRLSGMIIHEAN